MAPGRNQGGAGLPGVRVFRYFSVQTGLRFPRNAANPCWHMALPPSWATRVRQIPGLVDDRITHGVQTFVSQLLRNRRKFGRRTRGVRVADVSLPNNAFAVGSRRQ
jgi:hypothetical protein